MQNWLIAHPYYSYKNNTCAASTAVAQLFSNGARVLSVTTVPSERGLTLFIRLVTEPSKLIPGH